MHACEKWQFGGPTLCLADLQRKRLLTGTCDNPIMIPMRHSWIFRSRWMALIWAAGIIWLAVDIAVPDDSASNTEANATDVTANRGRVTDGGTGFPRMARWRPGALRAATIGGVLIALAAAVLRMRSRSRR